MFKVNSTDACWTAGQIDNITFSYVSASNKASKTIDAASTSGSTQRRAGFDPGSSAINTGSYAYDVNGNMTNDPYKALTISYNHLNLPTLFTFGSGSLIDVLYDRAGKKLRKTVKTSATTTQYVQDYVDGIEYRTTGTGVLTLEAIYTNEGRVTPNGAAWRYEYNIKDHLGNTRLTFADLNGNGIIDVTGVATTTEILNENHYYPFGMNMGYAWENNTATTMSIDNKYQYNGKEMNDDFGLNWFDYGARWYDASVSRWWSVDPLSEDYSRWSPFNYAVNNPVRFIDPDGRGAEDNFISGQLDVGERKLKTQTKADEEPITGTPPGSNTSMVVYTYTPRDNKTYYKTYTYYNVSRGEAIEFNALNAKNNGNGEVVTNSTFFKETKGSIIPNRYLLLRDPQSWTSVPKTFDKQSVGASSENTKMSAKWVGTSGVLTINYFNWGIADQIIAKSGKSILDTGECAFSDMSPQAENNFTMSRNLNVTVKPGPVSSSFLNTQWSYSISYSTTSIPVYSNGPSTRPNSQNGVPLGTKRTQN
jgi:RHS repeat-associated protein